MLKGVVCCLTLCTFNSGFVLYAQMLSRIFLDEDNKAMYLFIYLFIVSCHYNIKTFANIRFNSSCSYYLTIYNLISMHVLFLKIRFKSCFISAFFPFFFIHDSTPLQIKSCGFLFYKYWWEICNLLVQWLISFQELDVFARAQFFT